MTEKTLMQNGPGRIHTDRPFAYENNGTYVVTYFEENKPECHVSIIDGIYTHCGERRMFRNMAFPIMD